MDLDFERTLVSLAFTLFKHRTKGVGWIRGRALEEAFSSSGDPAPLLDSHADRSVVDSATVRIVAGKQATDITTVIGKGGHSPPPSLR